jgi:hypothetical protein
MLRSLRSRYTVLSFCGLLPLALAACSNSNPTSPDPGSGSAGTGASAGGGMTAGGSSSCRIFASALQLVTTGAGVTQTQDATCGFNPITNELTCAASYSDTLGSRFAST